MSMNSCREGEQHTDEGFGEAGNNKEAKIDILFSGRLENLFLIVKSPKQRENKFDVLDSVLRWRCCLCLHLPNLTTKSKVTPLSFPAKPTEIKIFKD